MASRHHRRAVRFFWAWLLGATLLSLAGNVTHALLAAPTGSRWLAAAVAAVPPTVLLAAVHGIAVLVKANASGAVYRTAVGATAALAAGAFLLSFVALRDLAVAVATIALVAVGDKPARRPRTATPSAAPAATATAPRSAGPRKVSATPVGPRPARDDHSAGTVSSGEQTARLAAELVAAKATRQPVETVEAILIAHDNGDPLNRIAAALGVHHSAVKRVVEAADAQRQLLLSA